MRYLFNLVVLPVLLFGVACSQVVTGDPIPTDRLYYPSDLIQNQTSLYVLNTNLNRRYQSGNLMQIDLPSGQIKETWLTPSLPGQLIATPDFSKFFVTGQDMPGLWDIFDSKQSNVKQNGPYFLTLFSGNQTGLLGYLYAPTSAQAEQASDVFELQTFELQSGAFSMTQKLRIRDCFGDNPNYIRVARLGGIQVVNQTVYMVAEFITSPAFMPQKHVFLFQIAQADVQNGNWNPQTCQTVDLSTMQQSQDVRSLIVLPNAQTAYILFDENPALVKLQLSSNPFKAAQQNSVTTCKGPSVLKLSPDQSTLLVGCGKSDQLAAYNASDLTLFGGFQGSKDPKRRDLGPADILFEYDPSDPKKPTGKIFVSFQAGHQIGIFKYANSSTQRSFDFFNWLELSR